MKGTKGIEKQLREIDPYRITNPYSVFKQLALGVYGIVALSHPGPEPRLVTSHASSPVTLWTFWPLNVIFAPSSV
jgi:hypothetical protein